MGEYEFTLRFDVTAVAGDSSSFPDRLAEAGCDDATVGIGIPGRIALMFSREAESAADAVLSALRDVRSALPGSRLIEATPDYVGVTEVAEIVGKTRQNMRKLLLNCKGSGPVPLHEGSSTVWHLAPVLEWLRDEKSYPIQDELLDVATTNMQLNAASVRVDVLPRIQHEVDELQEA